MRVIIRLSLKKRLLNSFFSNDCSSGAIKAKANQITINRGVLSNFAILLRERCDIYGGNISEYIDIGLHPNNARQSSDESKRLMRNFIMMEGDCLVAGCLLIIQRIRNNMFHGLKGLEMLNTQLNLFKGLNLVLENVRLERNDRN